MARIKKKTPVSRLLKTVLKRLFCHRNIIVISEHKTEHIPVSISFQFLVVSAVLGFVVWFSYSTGNYMATQSILEEKERKIASTNLENRRIESEFALLKRDLVKLIDEDQDKLSDYSKFVIEQYKNDEIGEGTPQMNLSKVASLNHGVVLERIAFLEKKVEAMKQDHYKVIESIRDATKGKIDELEDIIRSTGLNIRSLERAAKVKHEKIAANAADSDDPQGGPYDPAAREILMEYDEALYDDLQRMMLLDDVLNTLPLAKPMSGSRITSRFGMRVDPFRKRLARHSGIDFAGPYGSEIYATNDGTVKKAGRRGAYGNSVEIDHGLGVSTLYGHMKKVLVKPGETIKKGQIVGLQGNTGRSTGSHLHYEVRYRNRPIDPDDFLKAGKHVRAKKEK